LAIFEICVAEVEEESARTASAVREFLVGCGGVEVIGFFVETIGGFEFRRDLSAADVQ
jgi:hypothetical protein